MRPKCIWKKKSAINQEKLLEHSSKHVLVIGGGLSGTLAALKIGKKQKVLLIEQGNRIIPESSSSFNECYKLHTGLHYAGDISTALQILEAAIKAARNIPSDCIAGGKNLKSPSRRGRHFVMSNSLFPASHVKIIAVQLREKYKKLISEDPRNKIFGEPEDFIKFLEKSDYPQVAETIPFHSADGKFQENAKVALGIETAESQINIEKLQKHLEKQINLNKNIITKLNTKVTKLSYLKQGFGYAVSVEDKDGARKTYQVSSVINCAWQNIEYIDRTIGYYLPDENRVIRIKVCVKVKLPSALLSMNTCIFSVGPYCSFTNLGNGEAVLAYETVTNVGSYKAGNACPKEFAEMIQPLSPNKGIGKELGKKIREGCAQYFDEASGARAAMMAAPIVKIMVGHVKMMHTSEQYSRESLFQLHSPIHQREDLGIEVRNLGYISVSGNKMSFTWKNAEITHQILDRHFLGMKILNSWIQLIEPQVTQILQPHNKTHRRLIRNLILYIVCKEVFFSEFQNQPLILLKILFLNSQCGITKSTLDTLRKKDLVLQEIKSEGFSLKGNGVKCIDFRDSSQAFFFQMGKKVGKEEKEVVSQIFSKL